MSALSSGSLAAAIAATTAVLTDLGTMITIQLNWLPNFTAYLMISIALGGYIGYAIFHARDELLRAYSVNELRRTVGLSPILPKAASTTRVLTLVYSAGPARTIKRHPIDGYDQHAV